MRFFGHLIKGEISKRTEGNTSFFPNMNKAIEEPRLLYGMALKEQGSFGRFMARYFSNQLPSN
ncbi:MAG: hypothetical protein ACFFE3_11980, partial [Candidatus Thorarchaeota archaeon]